MIFTTTDNTEIASEISRRIALLNEMSESNLREEMRELKQALLENPAACSLLLDTDVNKMVSSLYKLTKQDIQTASEPKARKPREAKEKPKVLSAAELAAALEDDDF